LVVAFFVFGLGQATFHAQSTNLITTAFPTAKGRAMGIHGIGGSIGNFTAPILITFLIGLTSWRNATLMLTLPALLVFILLGFWLTEPPRPKKVDEKKFSFSAHLLFLALNFGLIYMVYVGFLTFLPTYLVENGATLEQAGRISAFMLFVGFFAQPLGGLIYDKLGGRFLFGASSLLASLGLFLFTSGTFLPVVVTIALIGVAATATFPVTLAMASEIAKGNNVGASVGFVFGVSGVLSSFAPALTGYTADSLGLLQSFRLLIVLAGLAFVVAFFLPKQKLEA
ncbi:MAG: MFS transporter, partial [Chloroflexota bacterium]